MQERQIADAVLKHVGIVLGCMTDDFGYPPAGDFADFKHGSEAAPTDAVPTLYLSVEDMQPYENGYRFLARAWTNGDAEDSLRMCRATLDALGNSPFADRASQYQSGLYRHGEAPEVVGAQIGLFYRAE